MTMARSGKMLQYINWRIRVTIQDNRYLVGTFLAFDKHMNIVLADCQEFRRVVPKGKKLSEEREECRVLGLVLLRGENVVGITAEAPPVYKAKGLAEGLAGPGIGRAAGRGLPPIPTGVPTAPVGPMPGVGVPSSVQMMPVPSSSPMTMAPPQPIMGRGAPPPTGPPPGPPGRGAPPPFPGQAPQMVGPPPQMMPGVHPQMMGRGMPMMPPHMMMMGRGGMPPPHIPPPGPGPTGPHTS